MTTGYSGRKLLLKRRTGTSPDTFDTIAALQDTEVQMSEETVDITNKDSAGIRQLLDGTILQAVTVSGSGVFSDDQSIADILTAFRAGTHDTYQIDVVSTEATTAGETMTGAFRITSFNRAGGTTDNVNYSITLESDGAITVA